MGKSEQQASNMKKILLETTLLIAGALNIYAQSKFTVANGAATAVTFTNGEKVNSVGPDKYWAQVYVTPSGGGVGDLAPVATAIAPIGVNATVANGLFNFGTVTIAHLDAHETVLLQVRGWLGRDVSGGYESAQNKGRNEAKPFTTRTSPPVVAFGPGGLSGFQFSAPPIPEPSGLMLAGFGLGGLLCLHRRK